MNYLLIEETANKRKVLINAGHLISISFNQIMNTIVVETMFTNYQCSFVKFIESKETVEVINNFNQSVADEPLKP